MRTKIISAFPGTGKTFFHKKQPTTTLDSDSSNFSWMKDSDGNNTSIRNPNFPSNYIEHIRENIGKYDYIFVSSHKEVRESLLDNCIFFYLVFPSINRKEEFIKRYRERGSSEKFISLINDKWDEWLTEIYQLFAEDGVVLLKMEDNNLEEALNDFIGESQMKVKLFNVAKQVASSFLTIPNLDVINENYLSYLSSIEDFEVENPIDDTILKILRGELIKIETNDNTIDTRPLTEEEFNNKLESDEWFAKKYKKNE